MVLSHLELFSISRWSEKIGDVKAAEAMMLARLDSDLPVGVIDGCRVQLREAQMPRVHESLADFGRLYERVRLGTADALLSGRDIAAGRPVADRWQQAGSRPAETMVPRTSSNLSKSIEITASIFFDFQRFSGLGAWIAVICIDVEGPWKAWEGGLHRFSFI